MADRSRRDAVFPSRAGLGADAARAPRDPFPLIKDHVLLRCARRLDAIDETMAAHADAGRRSPRSSAGFRTRGWRTATAAGDVAQRARRLRALSARAAGGAAAVSSRRPCVPADYTYDYAIVRVVPRVERGERINVGVILSCADAEFLDARIELDEAAAARAGSRARPRFDPARASRRFRRLRGRRRRRTDRRAAAARPLSLAGLAAQHHDPDVARAHRSHADPAAALERLLDTMVRSNL